MPLRTSLLRHDSLASTVCKVSERMGLYAKARADILKKFTGISDPYEEQKNREMHRYGGADTEHGGASSFDQAG